MKYTFFADHFLQRDYVKLPGSSVEQWTKRAAVVLALAIFVGVYAFGIFQYGPLLGIALGWLPAGTAAWLTATLLMVLSRPLTRRIAKPT